MIVNELFELLLNQGFKCTNFSKENYNPLRSVHFFDYKNIRLKFDWQYCHVYFNKKLVKSFILYEWPLFGQPITNYYQIPSSIIYLIENKKIYVYRKQKRKNPNRYISKKIRAELLIEYNYQCKYCNSSLNLEIDHIYPVSKGGSNKKENLQVLCKPCNRKKYNYHD